MQIGCEYITEGNVVFSRDCAYGTKQKIAACLDDSSAHLIATALNHLLRDAATAISKCDGIFSYTEKMFDPRL